MPLRGIACSNMIYTGNHVGAYSLSFSDKDGNDFWTINIDDKGGKEFVNDMFFVPFYAFRKYSTAVCTGYQEPTGSILEDMQIIEFNAYEVGGDSTDESIKY